MIELFLPALLKLVRIMLLLNLTIMALTLGKKGVHHIHDHCNVFHHPFMRFVCVHRQIMSHFQFFLHILQEIAFFYFTDPILFSSSVIVCLYLIEGSLCAQVLVSRLWNAAAI